MVPTKKEKLPLSVTHPELAKEADGWDPSTKSNSTCSPSFRSQRINNPRNWS